MALVVDTPEEGKIRFGFENQAEAVTDLLLDEPPTPFAIVIDGEWGSGKTTLLRMIKRILNDRDGSIKMIEFNAWQYERIDLFTSLLCLIRDQFPDNKRIAASIASLAADIILRKTVGMSKKEATAHFDRAVSGTKEIEGILKETVGEKLVIFIDDLDRCSMENTLAMLESMKLFLMVDNVIAVVAVDMEKIESAWGAKYGRAAKDGTGAGYVEKLFQLKLAVPHKRRDDLVEYVRQMAPPVAGIAEYLVDILPSNPRKMKLALNFLCLARMSSWTDRGSRERLKWMHALMAWFAVQDGHRRLAGMVKDSPENFVYLSYHCSKCETHLDFRKSMENILKERKTQTIADAIKRRGHMHIPSNLITEPLLDMADMCSEDHGIFRISQQFGLKIREYHDDPPPDASSKFLPVIGPACDLFKDVVGGV